MCVVFLLFALLHYVSSAFNNNTNNIEFGLNKTDSQVPCGNFPQISNAIVKILSNPYVTAHIECNEGFSLDGPPKVLCLGNSWEFRTLPRCLKKCKQPPYLENGEVAVRTRQEDSFNYLQEGTIAEYSCSDGYILTPSRSAFRFCRRGEWSGITPFCMSRKKNCKKPPDIENGYISRAKDQTSIKGPFDRYQYEPDDKIEYRCRSNYYLTGDRFKICLKDGTWAPKQETSCQETCYRPYACREPPNVTHGTPKEFYTGRSKGFWEVGAKLTYECSPGRELVGNTIITCSQGGCWLPVDLPICKKIFLEQLSEDTVQEFPVLLSLATGLGVLVLLIVICLVVMCRRRKPLARPPPMRPTIQRQHLADHATLFNHPDRLALITSADGFADHYNGLPTYEEAIRDRNGYSNSGRRPHFQNCSRRNRGSPNPDLVHVPRQGSFASHSASTRSGGDPMGSTDTMAVSENSTTVTLDTASSHSGSQAASCRVHCGSLASFDTNSVLNTEGVPLLEESELEELQCSLSPSGDNYSVSDNISIKFSGPTEPMP